ncbi:copper chaperone PCu(A)C [Eilatimonas milleporae]|uniref:Copper(I)-binding protein n=1 Tax=Eilatimonas milleporae TaxID=911205 RepID=A0A3M0BYN7_9PROT|nr:copper chaperone PCu(A)C [Eilatimonas milleporae]RMB02724.1 hypothetical protein BXY39_3075 [Eilatimonas milleporae]
MRLPATITALFLFAAVLFSAPATYGDTQDTITITDAWVRPTGQRAMSTAVYMTIANTGNAEAVLIGASSNAAEIVQIHKTSEENGIARMQPVERLPIAPGGTASLSPGGYHIMLIRLAAPLSAGDVIEVTLNFDGGGDITLPVTAGRP